MGEAFPSPWSTVPMGHLPPGAAPPAKGNLNQKLGSEKFHMLPPEPSFFPPPYSFLLIELNTYRIVFSFLFLPRGIPSAHHGLPVGKERETLTAKSPLF